MSIIVLMLPLPVLILVLVTDTAIVIIVIVVVVFRTPKTTKKIPKPDPGRGTSLAPLSKTSLNADSAAFSWLTRTFGPGEGVRV